jgi:pantetheine-phosphate adenylyltransferase
VEAIFLMSSLSYQYVSSSLLKEVVELGGDITDLVPEHVTELVKQKMGL